MLFGVDKLTYSNLKVDLEDLKNENKRLKDVIKGEISNAAFSIDWKIMNAFSIERNYDHRSIKTIIGYFVNNVVHEWSLYCSADEHERLVKEFNTHKGNTI
jgi:proteasome assembly chaperone (PAC2) family protein